MPRPYPLHLLDLSGPQLLKPRPLHPLAPLDLQLLRPHLLHLLDPQLLRPRQLDPLAQLDLQLLRPRQLNLLAPLDLLDPLGQLDPQLLKPHLLGQLPLECPANLLGPLALLFLEALLHQSPLLTPLDQSPPLDLQLLKPRQLGLLRQLTLGCLGGQQLLKPHPLGPSHLDHQYCQLGLSCLQGQSGLLGLQLLRPHLREW